MLFIKKYSTLLLSALFLIYIIIVTYSISHIFSPIQINFLNYNLTYKGLINAEEDYKFFSEIILVLILIFCPIIPLKLIKIEHDKFDIIINFILVSIAISSIYLKLNTIIETFNFRNKEFAFYYKINSIDLYNDQIILILYWVCLVTLFLIYISHFLIKPLFLASNFFSNQFKSILASTAVNILLFTISIFFLSYNLLTENGPPAFLSFSNRNKIKSEDDKGSRGNSGNSSNSSSCNCSDIGFNKILKLSNKVASVYEMTQRNLGTSMDIQQMKMKKISNCSWVVDYKIFDNQNQFEPPTYFSKKFICLDDEAFEE